MSSYDEDVTEEDRELDSLDNDTIYEEDYDEDNRRDDDAIDDLYF